jgi:hypothetical protein
VMEEGTSMYLTCSLCDPKCRSKKNPQIDAVPVYWWLLYMQVSSSGRLVKGSSENHVRCC